GGRSAEDRLGVRRRVAPPRAAAGVRPVAGEAALAPHAAVLAQRRDQIAQAGEVVEPVDERLDPRHAGRAEHHARELAKLRPDLVFTVRILIVAPGALA